MPARYKIDTFAKSILGNNCKKVDLFSASLVKGRGTVEDGEGILSSESNISMNSTTNSSTLFSMEVDEIGNMTKFNGYDFNWNGRRLESISQDGVELISYKYNIDGQNLRWITKKRKVARQCGFSFFVLLIIQYSSFIIHFLRLFSMKKINHFPLFLF